MEILKEDFYLRDGLVVAPELVGKLLIRKAGEGESGFGEDICLRITETECYMGETDTACHASKGRTKRTETLYKKGGTIYVYLCYGIHCLLNIITGEEGAPQGVLIRACKGYEGPGKLTKKLGVDMSFNGKNILTEPRLIIADDGYKPEIKPLPRVGIDYADKKDREVLWRFVDSGKGKGRA
ncbi:MAG: DNA-3-methyladenine glycosylase [Ruminococcus sp.]|nr:DNA-3-methyladenine glycosylase [Ruminococcus sp.]